jgi:2'-5' RNA ligase
MNEVTKLRLFVAVDAPEDQLARLNRAIAPLKEEYEKARWLPPANQHVTLKFLGSTPSDRFDAVKEVIDVVARSHAPTEVSVAGLGAFPSPRRARVLWAGIDDPASLLTGLAADLSGAFEPLGYRAEARAFTPHLTLARFKVPARLEGLPEGPAFDPFVVDRVLLYLSRLHPHGARYEVLDQFALSG